VSDVTQILNQIESGDGQAAEKLLPLVYDELRKLAAARMAKEDPGQTLQATALVHEAYLRLVDGEQSRCWDSRGHFFAAAAEAMRRILVERARTRVRRDVKRGRRIALETLSLGTPVPDGDMLALDEALAELEAVDSVAAQVVKLRFFAGFTVTEVADALGMSLRSAERNWTYARTWLHRFMEE
jgi:RNA polymerase sigma factor (TIGR02999 family)